MEFYSKERLMKNISNCNQDPFWINQTNAKTLKHLLKSHFPKC